MEELKNGVLNVHFYPKIWELVKGNMFGLLEDFYDGNLDVSISNYEVITLVPKGKDAAIIEKYRPICLLNMTLNFLIKVLVNIFVLVILSY